MNNLNKPQTKLELLALFGKARDGVLDTTEVGMLNDLLSSDHKVRSLYRGFIAVEAGLEELALEQTKLESLTVNDMSDLGETAHEIKLLPDDDEDDSEV